MRHKLIYILVFVCCLTKGSAIYAQKPTFTYYNAAWAITDKKNAYYIKEVKRVDDSLYLIKNYTVKKTPVFEGQFKSLEPLIENGVQKYYNKKGQLFFTVSYKHGKLYGESSYYDSTGLVIESMDYTQAFEYKYNKNIILRTNGFYFFKTPPVYKFNDEETNEKCKKKNIYYNVVFNNIPCLAYCESKTNDDAVTGNNWEESNVEKFIEDINCRLRYPKRCLENSISGKPIVQILIYENGKIDAKVLNKVDPDLEAEVLRVLLDSKEWTPVYYKGRPVMFNTAFVFNFSMK